MLDDVSVSRDCALGDSGVLSARETNVYTIYNKYMRYEREREREREREERERKAVKYRDARAIVGNI